jgi:hypothetical protein
MKLLGGVAAFDKNLTDSFLSKFRDNYASNAVVLTQNKSRPNSAIPLGFKDFPFVFSEGGTRKMEKEWCYLPPTIHNTYLELLGPCLPASTNNVGSSPPTQKAVPSD